jgi:hypothetical protein
MEAYAVTKRRHTPLNVNRAINVTGFCMYFKIHRTCFCIINADSEFVQKFLINKFCANLYLPAATFFMREQSAVFVALVNKSAMLVGNALRRPASNLLYNLSVVECAVRSTVNSFAVVGHFFNSSLWQFWGTVCRIRCETQSNVSFFFVLFFAIAIIM